MTALVESLPVSAIAYVFDTSRLDVSFQILIGRKFLRVISRELGGHSLMGFSETAKR